MPLTNFQSRAIIGAIYVGVTCFALLFHQFTAGLYIGVLCGLVLSEFYKITTQLTVKQRIVPIVFGYIIFGMVYANQDYNINIGYFAYWIIPTILLAMVYMIFSKSDKFVTFFTTVVAGWIYIPCALALLLRNGNLVFDESNMQLFPYHGIQILVVFILIWLNDTFAFLVGRKFGRNPLAAAISPKKTWEGFFGGMILTVLFSIVLHHFFSFIAIEHYLILALIVSVFSTLGDLFESKIKRDLGIKDSGTALGGHGGFLDRFDSILFAGPASYFYLFHLIVM